MKNGRTKEERAAIKADAETMCEATRGLSSRDRMFVAYYMQTFNAVEAIISAGYSGSRRDARFTAYHLMKQSKVKMAIEACMLDVFMDAAEMKARTSDQARATIEDFIVIADDGSFTWNLKQAQDRGKIALVKKLKSRTTKDGTTETELELHDAQSALVNIGKLHNLFVEQVRVKADVGDTPFDLMGKAFREMEEKGEKVAKLRK